MNNNLTEVIFLVDKSGSMWHLRDDTMGGYNAYIEKQKEDPGQTLLTTVLFDDHVYTLHDHEDVHAVEPLSPSNYSPEGSTALLDAIGLTIVSVGKRLSETPEEERPAHVIFVITTDGCENSSQEFSRRQIKEMIQHQEEKYSWQFIFLGAGIDAYGEASSIGICGMRAMSVTADSLGTDNLFQSVVNFTAAVKSANVSNLASAEWKVGDVGEIKGGTP